MPSIIRIKRRQIGLTQIQLAAKVNCTQGQISCVERDMNGISPDLAERLAAVLDIPKEELLYPNKGSGLSNRELFERNRQTRKIRQAMQHITYPSAPLQPYAQRRLIIRDGRVAQVINE